KQRTAAVRALVIVGLGFIQRAGAAETGAVMHGIVSQRIGDRGAVVMPRLRLTAVIGVNGAGEHGSAEAAGAATARPLSPGITEAALDGERDFEQIAKAVGSIVGGIGGIVLEGPIALVRQDHALQHVESLAYIQKARSHADKEVCPHIDAGIANNQLAC